MTRLISFVLLIGGIILIVYGISASNSVGSGFSRLFTGSPTDKTIWFMIGGCIAAVVGLSGVVRGSRSP